MSLHQSQPNNNSLGLLLKIVSTLRMEVIEP